MGSHVTFTPKISKLDVHLGYIQVPLSSNFHQNVFTLWYFSRFDDFRDPKL